MVTGCFLNEFGRRRFGHNPLPEFSRLHGTIDEAGISFDPDRCSGNGTITFRIPTTVMNQYREKEKITVIATFEVRNGKFRMTKGGVLVYETSMKKLRALKHKTCSVS